MDDDTRMKLKPILLRSKLGQFVSEGEREFARRCWGEWPKEYSALQTDEVNPEVAKHNASTRPANQFNGSQARMPRPARTPRTPRTPRGRRT